MSSHTDSTEKFTFTTTRIPRVLSIAGSDSSGGAGIQADIKSISACGGYAMTAITALTAQNTQGVQDILTPAPDFLRAQLDSVSSDVEIDAVKIGMLADSRVIQIVIDWVREYQPQIVVLDPVMVATSGDSLFAQESLAALKELCTLATVLTPNIAELAALTGNQSAQQREEALVQAHQLADETRAAVVVKGGHLEGKIARDAVVIAGQAEPIWAGESPRIETKNTHGTGCSLSSSLATFLAKTGNIAQAMEQSKNWLTQAITHADELHVGKGSGSVNHFFFLTGQDDGAEVELNKLRYDFATTVYELTADIRESVDTCDFVTALGNGTLDRDAFTYYLDQDALYLSEYSRALARVSLSAPSAETRLFFGRGFVEAVEVESSMHRNWITRYSDSPGITGIPGEVTKTYTDFLLAATAESYPVAAAAVLPCYWLYADIGLNLENQLAQYEGEHPFGEWLNTYGAESFQDVTRSAINYVDEAARTATDAQLIAMKNAFERACRLELAFFQAPLKVSLA